MAFSADLASFWRQMPRQKQLFITPTKGLFP